MAMTFVLATWDNGTLISRTENGEFANSLAATPALNAYIVAAIMQGDRVTYSEPYREFKISHHDSTLVEYASIQIKR